MPNMNYAKIDTSGYPIVKVTYAPQEPTLEEFDAYLSSMEALYDDYSDFVIIMDASSTKYLSSELRIRQGNWMKKNESKMKTQVLGIVFIIPSAIVRMILNGIFLIQKLPVPYSVSSNMEEANKWAHEKLSVKVT